MKKSLSALIACIMALTFAAPTVQARTFDSYAYSEIISAFTSASAVYNEHPTDANFSTVYYSYYAAYYLVLGAYYNNDTLRFYGYAYASYAFSAAYNAQASSPNDSSTFSANLFAAYYHAYYAYYYAYWAAAGF